jgi:spore coat protein A
MNGFVAGALRRAAMAALVLVGGPALGQPVQTPLDGATIPKFVDPVPTFVGQRVGGPVVSVSMKETTQKPLPASVYAPLPAPFNAGTAVWGYQITGLDTSTLLPVSRGPMWPGVTVEAQRNVPTNVVYTNDLKTPKLQKLLPVDQTINWADPLNLGCDFQATMSPACMDAYTGPVPTVIHLHGSEVPPAFDGGPDAWFTASGLHGSNFSTLAPLLPNQALYRYPNTQEGTTLWFHDHALGTTRLNVFGGIAALYLLRDAQDTGKPGNPLALPAGAQEVDLVIQDRSFDVNGQLMYFDPSQLAQPDVHPLWRPEFFGDVITVNGKSWPKMEVEPRRYRFRVLNGSNARFYNMTLARSFTSAGTDPVTGNEIGVSVTSPGPVLWQIGTDGGRLDAPVALNALQIAPGERADVIVDFSSLPLGTTLTLVNDANAPFPGGDPVATATTAQVMQFRVSKRLSSADATCNPAAAGASACKLRPGNPIIRLADPTTGTVAPGVSVAAKRQLILREIEGSLGPVNVFVNNTTYSGLKQSTLTAGTPQPVAGSIGLGENFVTEAPRVGSTEIWEVANLTEDAHPIHIHLIQFQVVNRETINTGRDEITGVPTPGGYLSDYLKAVGDPAPDAVDVVKGDGPPRAYAKKNADGAIGGNLPFSKYLLHDAAPPAANEAGWKDTVVMYPGTVTRLAVRWAPQGASLASAKPGTNLFAFDPSLTDRNARDAFGNPGASGYAWHCHILEHEDNEMMRPYAVAR